ncbi:MAG: SufE family protein [Chloroflexota bacterium]|jgi:cysteine desulfuration protein SufE|nr:SufE family protein [Chloroflexota bacterium]
MASIQEIQAEIVEDFSFLPQWDERYAYLIELGQKMESLPNEYRTEENIVRGCQSLVWLHRECHDGTVYFQADSNSLIVKGLASLLMRVFSDQSAEAVLEADLAFFEQTGLNKHLSSQRANGLMAMVDEIKTFAAKCAAGKA